MVSGNGSGKENVFDIANEMKTVMFDDVGVFRNGKGMQTALAKVQELRNASSKSRSRIPVRFSTSIC